jgi:hypothetical protein
LFPPHAFDLRLHRRQIRLNRSNSSAPPQIARSPHEEDCARGRERAEGERAELVALRCDSTPKPKNKSIAQDTTNTISGQEIELASSRDMSSRVCWGGDWELAPLSDGGVGRKIGTAPLQQIEEYTQ